MSNRGPKPQTSSNKAQSPPRAIPIDQIVPTADLHKDALVEFRRLITVLDARGSLDRIDLSLPTECARITDTLNCAHRLNAVVFDSKMVSTIAQLTSQRRGLLREMGLSIQPSRTHVHTTAKSSETPADPIAGKIKIHA